MANSLNTSKDKANNGAHSVDDAAASAVAAASSYRYIYGNDLNNVLYGGDSSFDVIYGFGGDDTLYGGGATDYLYGGTGNDILDGGIHPDAFIFDTAPGPGNVDTIQNYVVAEDAIWLENAVFTALTVTGTLSAAAFCVGAAAQDAADRIIYNSATGALYYDADGTGAAAQVQFATLVGVTGTVTNTEFEVY